MKKFRFPLESVRAWRRLLWEQEENRLEKLVAEMRQIELNRRELHTASERDATRITSLITLTTKDLASLEHLRAYVREEDRRLAEKAERMRLAIDQQRRKLIDARRQYEAVDKLRERQYQNWAIEAGREEAAQIGELAIGRWQQRTTQRADGT